MTVKRKTVFLTAIVLVIVAGISFIQFNSLRRVELEWQDHLEKAVKRQRLLTEVRSQFGYGGFIHNFKNHVLRGQEKFVDRFEKNKTVMMDAIDKLEEMADSPAEKQANADIRAVAEKYIAAIQVSVKMHGEGKSPQEIDKVVKINDGPAFKAFGVIEKIADDMEADSEVTMHATLVSLKTYVAESLAVVIIVLGCYIFLLLTVVRKIGGLKTFAQAVGAGDLTVKSGINASDEVGIIAAELDKMVDDLNEMFANINANAASLSESSETLSGTSADMNANANDVQLKSHAVASAAEQMSDNMNSVSAAVEQASSSVDTVSQAAGSMLSMITDISRNTEEAHGISRAAVEEAREVSLKVSELGDAARSISKVTETISDISEQTNLLALNATIEAARAGEAGKGFGVVANEIKELASQTGTATLEISNSISNIQNSMTETTDRISRITGVINEVNGIVETIDSAVDEQSASTNEIAGNVREVSVSLDKVAEQVAQSSGVAGEVANDIGDVNQSAVKVSGSSADLSVKSGQLNELAGHLHEVVRKFKL
ncbi:MAG: methyl-accepting chemotaxis protein [Desulfobacterales bacterium]|nr:methyl-accepting chemotaxis protein [Desulfobacterales bacterium]